MESHKVSFVQEMENETAFHSHICLRPSTEGIVHGRQDGSRSLRKRRVAAHRGAQLVSVRARIQIVGVNQAQICHVLTVHGCRIAQW